jgi:acyl-coenzyme A thioesterase PaaI-like protein
MGTRGTGPGTTARAYAPPMAGDNAPLQEDIHASPSRIAAATALRRLGHAFVGHQIPDALLDRVTERVLALLPEIESGAARSRPVDDMKRRLFESPPEDGGSMDHFPDCVVSGQANPMGIAITVHRDGDDAVATVNLGAAFEGAPQRAHGGIVASIFDDTMGFVLSMVQTPAFTGRLTVSYLAPTPLGVEITFRSRLRDRDGRKLFIEGEALHGTTRFAEAEGLFISIPSDRFAAGAPRG